jgi:hypothetical protein
MNVPTEAIGAAAEAIADIHGRRMNGSNAEYYRQVATAALQAAAPLIAAAERDRIRRHAQEHTFRLYRPSNGPNHGHTINVVPLTSLLEIL